VFADAAQDGEDVGVGDLVADFAAVTFGFEQKVGPHVVEVLGNGGGGQAHEVGKLSDVEVGVVVQELDDAEALGMGQHAEATGGGLENLIGNGRGHGAHDFNIS
jgi:hypothetical protein